MASYKVSVTTTGSAGSASGSGTTERPVRGFLVGIKLDYHASAPATTDVTIAETGAIGRTLMTRSNSATDAMVYPSVQLADSTNTSVTSYLAPYIDGEYLSFTLAQCDALTNALVAHVLIAE